jgi:hypothetical protein
LGPDEEDADADADDVPQDADEGAWTRTMRHASDEDEGACGTARMRGHAMGWV